jgi:hypothetical protein
MGDMPGQVLDVPLVLRLENAFTVEPPFRAGHAGLKPGATMT